MSKKKSEPIRTPVSAQISLPNRYWVIETPNEDGFWEEYDTGDVDMTSPADAIKAFNEAITKDRLDPHNANIGQYRLVKIERTITQTVTFE